MRERETCLELGVVGEAGQGEEQTQLAVVVFTGTELLQSMKTLHCLLHGELQLRRDTTQNQNFTDSNHTYSFTFFKSTKIQPQTERWTLQ